MGFIIVLPGLAVLWLLNKKIKPKGKVKKWFNVATMATALVVGVGLAYTILGRWVADVVGWISSLLSHLTGIDLAVAVALALTLAMAGWAYADIAHDRKADKGAQFAAILAPTLLLLVIGGALHSSGGGAVQTAETHLQALMAHLGGGR
jgi:hypothetical protein